MNRRSADGVFAGSNVERGGVGGEVEVVNLDAAGGGIRRAVGVDGEEEVGLRLVGDGGASFERDERVVRTGVNDLRAKPIMQQFADPQRDIQHDVFFLNAVD